MTANNLHNPLLLLDKEQAIKNACIKELKESLASVNDDDLGAWTEMKRKLKQRYPFLTNEDLVFYEGREEELINRILQKIGNSSANLQNLLAVL